MWIKCYRSVCSFYIYIIFCRNIPTDHEVMKWYLWPYLVYAYGWTIKIEYRHRIILLLLNLVSSLFQTIDMIMRYPDGSTMNSIEWNIFWRQFNDHKAWHLSDESAMNLSIQWLPINNVARFDSPLYKCGLRMIIADVPDYGIWKQICI